MRLSRRHWRLTYQRKHQSQHQRSQPCNQRQFFKFLRISHHFKSTPIFQILWKENLITSSAGHESHRRSLSHHHLLAEKKIYNRDLIFEHPEKEIYKCDLRFENPKILIWVLKNPPWSRFLHRSTYSSEPRSQGYCCNPFGMIASSTNMLFCVL